MRTTGPTRLPASTHPERTALVLGATGGIGGELSRELMRAGWSVRALARHPSVAAAAFAGEPRQPRFIAGDAMDPASVRAAARGAALVVHAVNPPGYRHWERLSLPMLDHAIDAAASAVPGGARLLLPGTVYNFGPDAYARPMAEDAPQHPVTRKGAVRVEMEARLARAAHDGRCRVLVVRAGDFFGPRAGNNWFSQGLVRPGRALRAITLPGTPGVGHQWAYLPDVARTMVRLLAREGTSGPFERFHMEGHWDPDGLRLAEAIRRAAGDPALPVRRLPWTLLALASPVVPLFRELREMRYMWRHPVRLRNDRLLATLGEEPRTPLDEAVRETLRGLGCLGGAAGGMVRS